MPRETLSARRSIILLGPMLWDEQHGSDWQDRVLLHPKPNETPYLEKDPARWHAFRPGGLLAKPFLSKLKIMVKIGNTIFVHAGFRSEDIPQPGGIAELNSVARQWILTDVLDDKMRVDEEYDAVPFDPEVLVMRRYSQRDRYGELAKKVEKDVKDALAVFHADRMVVGHTHNAGQD